MFKQRIKQISMNVEKEMLGVDAYNEKSSTYYIDEKGNSSNFYNNYVWDKKNNKSSFDKKGNRPGL